jgi:hypothetical protein
MAFRSSPNSIQISTSSELTNLFTVYYSGLLDVGTILYLNYDMTTFLNSGNYFYEAELVYNIEVVNGEITEYL